MPRQQGATVETDYIFYGYCPDCATGSEPGEAVDANQWVADHNRDNHQEGDD